MANDKPESNEAPTLTDVLAALVTSVSQARVQADVSSAQVARLYQQHDLLRAMPVPRLRLNKVNLSVPFVMTGVRVAVPFELATPDAIAAGLVKDLAGVLRTFKDLGSEVGAALEDTTLLASQSSARAFLEGAQIVRKDIVRAFESSMDPSANSPFDKQFEQAIAEIFSDYSDGSDAGAMRDATSETDIRDRVAEAIRAVLRRRLSGRRHHMKDGGAGGTPIPERNYSIMLGDTPPEQLEEDVRGSYVEDLYHRLLRFVPDMLRTMGVSAGNRAFTRTSRPPQVEIMADTADVKNQSNPGTVTRLNITLSEEGLEWVAESGETGDPQWKLMPE